MPRFYFHLAEDAAVLTDQEGLALPDRTAAREIAIYQIRAIVAQEIRETGQLWLSRHIDIADDDGAIFDRVVFGEAVSAIDMARI